MGAYNSGNLRFCTTLSKASLISSLKIIAASTRTKGLISSSLKIALVLTKSKSLPIVESNFVNQLTTFQALFGITSYQSATAIYIKKAELAGLTIKNNNSAESLLVALLLLWVKYAKGKIDGKISIDRWGVYLADSKVRYVLSANFYRQLTVIDNEVQQISDSFTPGDF